MTILFDRDSNGPIPRLTLLGSLLATAAVIGFLIYNIQHSIPEFKYILFNPFINHEEKVEENEKEDKLKVN